MFLITSLLAIYKNFFDAFSPTREPLMFGIFVVFALTMVLLAFTVSVIAGLFSIFGWAFALPAMIWLISKR